MAILSEVLREIKAEQIVLNKVKLIVKIKSINHFLFVCGFVWGTEGASHIIIECVCVFMCLCVTIINLKRGNKVRIYMWRSMKIGKREGKLCYYIIIWKIEEKCFKITLIPEVRTGTI